MQELRVLAAEVELATKTSVTSYKNKLESYTKKRKRELEDAMRRANTSRYTPRSAVSTPATPLINTAIARGDEPPLSPKSTRPLRLDTPTVLSRTGSDYGFDTPHIATPTAEMSLRDLENRQGSVSPATNGVGPHSAALGQHLMVATVGADAPVPEPRALNTLKGVKVVIIHVKERLNDDEPAGDRILRELQDHEAEAQTGVEFMVSGKGQSFYF